MTWLLSCVEWVVNGGLKFEAHFKLEGMREGPRAKDLKLHREPVWMMTWYSSYS